MTRRYEKHGGSRSQEYRVFSRMLCRCYNPRNKRYKDYGARGITVCDQWICSFSRFLEDMGKRPTSGHSLDRKDVNGNYNPKNCRWAIRKQQDTNKRCNHFLACNGDTKTVVEWSEFSGIRPRVIMYRIYEAGMSVEEALTKKLADHKTEGIEFRGERLSIAEWSRRLGMKTRTIGQRLKRSGGDVEYALTAPVSRSRKGIRRKAEQEVP